MSSPYWSLSSRPNYHTMASRWISKYGKSERRLVVVPCFLPSSMSSCITIEEKSTVQYYTPADNSDLNLKSQPSDLNQTIPKHSQSQKNTRDNKTESETRYECLRRRTQMATTPHFTICNFDAMSMCLDLQTVVVNVKVE